MTAKDLRDRISLAKKKALREIGGDFASADGQIVALDADGERVREDFDGFNRCPSLKSLRAIFKDNPGAATLCVESDTRYFAEYGNAATQREESTPCDWWTVEVTRADLGC